MLPLNSSPSLSHTSFKSGSNGSWLSQSCHSTQGNWDSLLSQTALYSDSPDPFDSRMWKGEAGELCALPRALRMTLLFIYSTWDHLAWPVVFPILLGNVHHHLIWFQQTEFCCLQYMSQKASVKATLRVKFFRVGAVPAQTCELQNQSGISWRPQWWLL